MENNQNSGRRTGTIRLAKMGMLVAIAVVLVYLIHFPILPMLPFMEYDPADVPIMIGTFAFGPLAGIAYSGNMPCSGTYCQRIKRRIRNYHALCRYRNLCACGRTDLL